MHRLWSAVLKYPLLALAGLTSLGAALIIVFSLVPPERTESDPLFWTVRVLFAAAVLVFGLLTGMHFVRGKSGAALEWTLLLGSIALVAAGGFGTAWSLHMGEVTGDYEYYTTLINMMLVAEGALMILRLWEARRRALA